ncbi:MAG: winged-helix domain-containing protein [Candidatus Bathyarchaeia archaeon]
MRQVIAKKLREREYGLDERTVRYYLRILDERG